MERDVYTPSELNREVRIHLEGGFPRIWVEGEISNLARPASGHLYFSLKDERAQLRCALFRSHAARIGFRPENGQQVQVRGRLSLYEPRGDFQLIADTMEAAGEGRLRAAFEALRKKLEAEGLFDAAHKQPLPPYPRRIGVITSPSGAVIRDILHVLARRWPLAAVRLYPVPVQGPEAPPALVHALTVANRHGWAQALILGRGGGSLEDLWAFNEEAVARAVHASAIPVISAVGHETDYGMTDFVADLRAPTPSAAAELLVPDQQVLRRGLQSQLDALGRRTRDALGRRAQRVDELSGRLSRQHPGRRVAELRRRLEGCRGRLTSAITRLVPERRRAVTAAHTMLRLAARRPVRERADRLRPLAGRLGQAGRRLLPERRRALQSLARTLHAVSPLPTLERGYSILTLEASGVAVQEPGQVGPGDRVVNQLARGRVISVVEQTDDAGPEPTDPGAG